MNSQPSKRLVNSLAMLVIVGILALIATSLSISTRSRDVFGPTFLATDAAGRVYVNIGTALYRLDREGRLEQRIPLEVLGIHDEPVTDALVMPDGTLLLGSSGASRIVSCTLEKPACTAFLKSGPQPASAFKMVWDDTRNRLLVVDGEGHRILGYDRTGAFTGQYAGGEQGLRFPNTAVLTAADELVVADTNHHRLVALDAETLSSEQWELAVRNEVGNFRRIWPTDVVMTATNGFWVILDDDLLKHGDIILFDSAGTARQRLDLPADWDPVKLRARKDDVLVAGFGSVDLLSVSLDGKVIRPFGDSAFRADLADMRAARSSNDRWWQLWIWIVLVPLVALAIVTAWLDHRRRAREPAVSVAADQPATLMAAADGICWLEPDPMIVKLWKYTRRVLYLLPLLILIPVVLIISMAGYDAVKELVLMLLAIFVPIFILLHSGIRVITGGRLGVTGDHIVLGTRDQLRRRVQPGQLVYGTRFISSGDVTVYTRTGKGPIYRDADMRRYILPRLQAARSLNAFAGWLYLLREGERLTVVSTVAIAWLAGLVFYMEICLR